MPKETFFLQCSMKICCLARWPRTAEFKVHSRRYLAAKMLNYVWEQNHSIECELHIFIIHADKMSLAQHAQDSQAGNYRRILYILDAYMTINSMLSPFPFSLSSPPLPSPAAASSSSSSCLHEKYKLAVRAPEFWVLTQSVN